MKRSGPLGQKPPKEHTRNSVGRIRTPCSAHPLRLDVHFRAAPSFPPLTLQPVTLPPLSCGSSPVCTSIAAAPDGSCAVLVMNRRFTPFLSHCLPDPPPLLIVSSFACGSVLVCVAIPPSDSPLFTLTPSLPNRTQIFNASIKRHGASR
jgi:hypothetical protein